MAQDEIEAWNEDGERGPSEAGRYLDEAQSLLQIITDMLTAAKRASVDGEHGGQQDVKLADVARDVVAIPAADGRARVDHGTGGRRGGG